MSVLLYFITTQIPEIIPLSRYERPAGLLITLYVYIVYVIALRYEGYVLHTVLTLFHALNALCFTKSPPSLPQTAHLRT